MTEAGRLIGPHRVLSVLGKGGMGTVLRAASPDGREVAIKVLRFTAPQPVARFEREARLLASLGEGFVPILETGTSDGFPYIVMPLLPGGTLDDKLRRGPLPIDETVALVAALARAIGAAHEQGIVHRDLKPANVLFTADGVPLVADLGLAKHFDLEAPGASRSVSLSKTGMARGTYGYMAPEQLKDAKSVGPSADVFSLGTILYECLTGRPPFAGDSHLAVVDATVQGRFEPLEKARPETPGWLAAVVARALAPDPARRFQDGRDLARALETGGAERRRRWPAALALALVLALVVGVYRRRPVVEPPPPQPAVAPLPAPFDRVASGGRLRLAAAWGDPAWDLTSCHALTFTPDGRRVLAAGEEAIWVIDASTGFVEKLLEPGHGEVGACACSPDGKLVLVASHGRPPPPGGRFQPYPSGPPCLQLWELESGKLVATLDEGGFPSVAFSANGALALATGPDGIRVYETATRKRLATLASADGGGVLSTGPPGSAGDERVLFGGPAIRLWDPVSRTSLNVEGHPGGTTAVALFADRRHAATGGADGGVRIWDLATGESTAIGAHQGRVAAIALTRDERTLVSSGADGAIGIWDLVTRNAKLIARPHEYDGPGLDYFKGAGAVAISPDGKRVVVSAWDSRLRVYGLDGKLQAGGSVPASQVPGLAVDPRGRFVVTGARDGTVLVRDMRGSVVKSLDARAGEVWSVAFAGDGTALAAAGWAGDAVVWDVPSWRERGRWSDGSMTFAVTLDATGKRIATAGWNNMNRVRDVASGEVLAQFEGHAPWLRCIAFTGSGLVGAVSNDTSVLWDLGTRSAVRSFKVEYELQALDVSSDGRLLVLASNDKRARIFALSSGTPIHTLDACDAKVTGCAFSRDGALLATGGEDRTVRVWETSSGRELGRVSIAPIADMPGGMAFAPDGALFVSTDRGLVLRFEVARP